MGDAAHGAPRLVGAADQRSMLATGGTASVVVQTLPFNGAAICISARLQ